MIIYNKKYEYPIKETEYIRYPYKKDSIIINNSFYELFWWTSKYRLSYHKPTLARPPKSFTVNRQIYHRISNRIRKIRKKLGYTQKALGEYLHERWGMSSTAAIGYISQLENNPYINEQRLADYLTALGIDEHKARDVLRGIEKIQPDFRFLHSDVKPLLSKRYLNSLKPPGIPDKIRRIKRRIKQERMKKGYSIHELAEYIHTHWGVTTNTVITFIGSLENGGLIDRLQNAHRYKIGGKHGVTTSLQVKQKHITDYLAALGITGSDMNAIIDNIKEIQPRFNYVFSDVVPYNPDESNIYTALFQRSQILGQKTLKS